jgi:lipoprotein signal peptidase
MPERSYRVVLWTLALLGVSLDQATKYGVFAWLSGAEPNSRPIFSTDNGGFQLVAQSEPGTDGKVPHVNQGALFGFLKDHKEAANVGFAVISLLAALAIAIWSMQTSTGRDPWLCTALGLILAGTLGNLYDRVVFNGVRDFLYWNYRFDWPVFNFADCCLVCGAALLLIQAFLAPAAKAAREPVAAEVNGVPQTTQQMSQNVVRLP